MDVTENGRKKAAARCFLVNMACEFHFSGEECRTTAYEVFCHGYNNLTITAPHWVRKLFPKVSRKSLFNWEKSMAGRDLEALVDKRGLHRIGSGLIDRDPKIAECIIAEIFAFADVPAPSVLESLEARFPERPLPSLRGLQRWMKAFRSRNSQVIMRVQNPDGWRSKFQSAAGSRSAGTIRPNQVWELDSSPADVILSGGKRHTLLACVDVATRRAVLHLAETSSAQGVCALIRKSLLALGVPESIKMDNGADYTSYQVTSVMLGLGIRPLWCKPFTPEEKPHIERLFKTFQHGFCTRLPGYVGHSVAERRAIESSLASYRRSGRTGAWQMMEFRYEPDQFRALCEAWVRDSYNERVHSELGRSPNDAAALSGHQTRRIEDERALDILLMPLAGNGGLRVVAKKGLRVEGGVYNSPVLGGLEGEQVQVRRDQEDAGQVYVFSLEGEFICRAEDPELTGVSLRELAMARKARQKSVLREKMLEVRKIVARVRPHESAALILEQKSRQAGEKRTARRAGPSGPYSTPALEQAAAAADECAGLADDACRSKRNVTGQERVVRDLSGREAFWTSLEFEEKLLAGVSLSPAELRWLHGYQSTNFYRTWRAMYDDFGSGIFDGMEAAS